MIQLPMFWPQAAREEVAALRQSGELDERVVASTERAIRRNLILWSIGSVFFFLQGAQVLVFLLVLVLIPAMRYDVKRYLANRSLKREEFSEDLEDGVQQS